MCVIAVYSADIALKRYSVSMAVLLWRLIITHHQFAADRGTEHRKASMLVSILTNEIIVIEQAVVLIEH